MYASFGRAVIVLSLVAACGALGGIHAACVGAGVGYALHTLLTIAASSRVSGLPFMRYVAASFRPVLPCVPMFFAVYELGHLLAAQGVPPLVSLLAQISAGAIIYVAAAFLLVGESARELLRVGAQALRRR
jgi:hypothetical protein